MQKYDVIIIGGGVSGLSCAITLGSAGAKLEIAAEKKILVIDAGKSHLNMAELYNVPGIGKGTKGPELLASLAQRAQEYENISLIAGNVVEVSGNAGEFNVNTESGECFGTVAIVFANGMQTIAIEGIGADVVDHIRAPRPGMVMIKNDNGKIGESKYVTGCAAGATSMFASAAGYGAQTATDIISEWVGKYTVIHDVLKKG
ncbi:FAD-dependent oxidoreductase [Sulfuricurvum sp.]|uniref:FAD-dependent oxidoreductase n=1 Tax=Sulfuricurvum sp. TaxID=2025608 RepID=UPI00262130B4|nr:FAD-dependent oxidoreductase [Sulfuricurvum sp.]MDD3597216.1 FAD-dependent oxidoreductase [Sulfuricurvum sp.]